MTSGSSSLDYFSCFTTNQEPSVQRLRCLQQNPPAIFNPALNQNQKFDPFNLMNESLSFSPKVFRELAFAQWVNTQLVKEFQEMGARDGAEMSKALKRKKRHKVKTEAIKWEEYHKHVEMQEAMGGVGAIGSEREKESKNIRLKSSMFLRPENWQTTFQINGKTVIGEVLKKSNEEKEEEDASSTNGNFEEKDGKQEDTDKQPDSDGTPSGDSSDKSE